MIHRYAIVVYTSRIAASVPSVTMPNMVQLYVIYQAVIDVRYSRRSLIIFSIKSLMIKRRKIYSLTG